MWGVLFIFLVPHSQSTNSMPATTHDAELQVLKSNRTGIEFIYTPIIRDNRPCGPGITDCRLQIANTIPQPEPGKPNVPIKYISIGVPIGAKVDVKVIESITAESTGVIIPPTYSFTQQERDETIYSVDAYWPTEIVSINEQSLYREQEVLRLRLNPIRYNPVRKQLLIYKKLRISINFSGGAGVPVEDKEFDPVFKRVLINYEQAKNWRKPRKPKPILHHPGPWFKIELQEQGIYKIGNQQLKTAGIVNVNPKTIKLYNGGSKMVTDSTDTLLELPIRVLPDTSIIFYATSLHGWGKNGKVFLNPYTQTNVYWLTYGGEDGRRDSIPGAITPNLQTPTSFIDTLHIERDVICPAKSGLAWVWERIEREKALPSLKKDYNFNINGLITDTGKIRAAIYGWYADGSNQTESDNMWHNIRLYLNGIAFFDTSWKKGDTRPRIFERTTTLLKEGSNTFTVELYKGTYEGRDIVFFDWVEVSYKRKYSAVNGNLSFKSTDVNQKIELRGFTESPVIFEISNPINPKFIYGTVYEDGIVKFKSPNQAHYFASSNFKTPILTSASPYNLRDRTVDLDFIIITHPDFIDYANALKAHRQAQGLFTEVFSVEDIYNNFSWGLRHSPYSIRNFLSFAYDNWNASYCLLFGAGTYAYRDEELVKNRIPPWESGYKVGEFGYPPSDNKCFDSWFTNRNMAIGRITVSSKDEARNVVAQKIIKYEKNPGAWQNRVLLIADDENGDKPGIDQCAFVNYMETLEQEIPEYYDMFKLYLMNYTAMGREKPTARFDLIKTWNSGQFLNFYAGHGNLLQLCHEVLFYNPRDIEALNNGIKLPISHFSSCGVGGFEREYKDGMADYLQKINSKGSIATLGETRVSTLHWDIAQRIVYWTLVEPQRRAGQVIYGLNLDLNLPENCNLFTDPATLLPNRTIQTAIDSFSSPLQGGKLLRIWGRAPGAKFAHITVMSAEYNYIYTYVIGTTHHSCSYKMRGRLINEQLCENILFEGTVKVENGNWYHEFFIPVEIDTIICGQGKISVFAWNDTACGSASVKPIIIRGTPNPLDSVGPRIELFANGRLLRHGELVPSDFILTGVLEDESGINTFNKILPYNLALMLRVKGRDYPLADFFQYDVGSGRRGSFNYPLHLNPLDLEDTLIVQASDNLGNRNVYSVAVKVVSSAHIEIKRLINYPNPVRGEHTYFTFFLSKPAMVTVKIYTIAGRLIRTLPIQNKSPGINQIYWDTRDELGNRVGNGIYIYKISAISETVTKEETVQTSKLMILR